jgi:hypothetical protein
MDVPQCTVRLPETCSTSIVRRFKHDVLRYRTALSCKVIWEGRLSATLRCTSVRRYTEYWVSDNALRMLSLSALGRTTA